MFNFTFFKTKKLHLINPKKQRTRSKPSKNNRKKRRVKKNSYKKRMRGG